MGFYNYSLWKHLYALTTKTLLNVKHTMKNYIRVEEVNMTRQGHPYLHRV
jgi:hypothetical protein